MQPVDSSLETLLSEAVEIANDNERDVYLRRACGSDGSKLADLQSMVRDFFAAGSIIDRPAAVAPTLAAESTTHISRQIGPYKLRELLGEGGMGSVYVAEQEKPVRRKVALKIIKPGMGSREVISRFESERQALALMDHANIARILDGGATDSGQPYFVMELVRGIPITEYCDLHRLTTRARLEIFQQVCRAVQHAHQKGVIHRDIKPSNVLVAEIDGAAVPKVIDFGVAKAINQTLTEHTVYTRFSQMVGTPLYMSPEQAGTGVVDIDTRSDVYSLGVLLYELLTGDTPFEREVLKQVSLDEMRRIIREQEPPRPSLRVSTLKAELESTIAARRDCQPNTLASSLKGELDWIVMKSLEKDRARRYESASALAADIQRHLADEPILACPPSKLYWLQKFSRRHKVALSFAAFFIAVLVVGIAGLGTSVMLIAQQRDEAQTERENAQEQRDRAEELRVQAVQQQQNAEKQERIAEENFRRAREAVDTFLTKVSEDQLLNAPGLQPLRKDLLELAGKYYQQFVDDGRSDSELQEELAAAHYRLGQINRDLGDTVTARKEHQVSLEIRTAIAAKEPMNAEVRNAMAESYLSLSNLSKKFAEAVDYVEKAVEVANALVDPGHRTTLGKAYTYLGIWKQRQFKNSGGVEKMEEARTALENAVKIFEAQKLENFAKHQPGLLSDVYNALAIWHKDMGNKDQSTALWNRALAIRKQRVEEAPDDILRLDALSTIYWNLDELEKSTEITKKIADKNPALPSFQLTLADSYAWIGQKQKDPAKLEQALEILEKLVRDYPQDNNYPGTLGARFKDLGNLQTESNRFDQAIAAFNSSIAVLSKLTYAEGQLSDAFFGLSKALDKAGKLDEAITAQQSASEVGERLVQKFPGQLHYRKACAGNYRRLAGLLRRAGRDDETIAAYLDGVKLLSAVFADGQEPDGTSTQIAAAQDELTTLQTELAQFLTQLGQTDEAAECYRNAVKIATLVIEKDPSLAQSWSRRGTILQKAGENQKAIDDLSEALRLDSKVDKYWSARGKAYFQLQQDELALADQTKALELNSSSADFLKQRGWTLLRMGQSQLALIDTNAAIQLEPKNAAYLKQRGEIYQALGDTSRAQQDFEAASEYKSTTK